MCYAFFFFLKLKAPCAYLATFYGTRFDPFTQIYNKLNVDHTSDEVQKLKIVTSSSSPPPPPLTHKDNRKMKGYIARTKWDLFLGFGFLNPI